MTIGAVDFSDRYRNEQLFRVGAVTFSAEGKVIRRALRTCRVGTGADGANRSRAKELILSAGVEYRTGLEDRVISFTGSDETPDRYNTIVRVSGWELENFRANPVFMWAHDYSQPPIGRVLAVDAILEIGAQGGYNKALVFDVLFAEAMTSPFADQIYRLYRDGFLHAVSVGWQTLESRLIEDAEEARRLGLDPDDAIFWPEEITRQELLELSAAPVPGNPSALKRVVEIGAWRDSLSQPTRGTRPYPHEHACRLRDPGDFQDGSFVSQDRVHDGKLYRALLGRLEGEEELTEQAYRYGDDIWSAAAARAHCEAHDGAQFEPAIGKDSAGSPDRVMSDELKIVLFEELGKLRTALAAPGIK